MKIRSFLQETFQIENTALLDRLCALSKRVDYKAGERILTQGEVPEYINFLLSGVVRGFYNDTGNCEITDGFYVRRGFALTDSHLFQASLFEFVALTETSVISISIKGLIGLLSEFKELIYIYILLMQESLSRQWIIRHVITTMSVKQRYKWFSENYPQCVDVATVGQIASFLGTTRESISRVRNSDLSTVEVYSTPVVDNWMKAEASDRDGRQIFMRRLLMFDTPLQKSVDKESGEEFAFRAEQRRAEQSRAEQSRAEQSRAEQKYFIFHL